MLIISRTRGSAIVFPRLNISVKVIKVGARHIRLGIDAPEGIVVVRDELLKPGDPFYKEKEHANVIQ